MDVPDSVLGDFLRENKSPQELKNIRQQIIEWIFEKNSSYTMADCHVLYLRCGNLVLETRKI